MQHYVVAAVILILAVAIAAAVYLRRSGSGASEEQVRAEFIAYLQKEFPSGQVEIVAPRELKVVSAKDKELTVYLDNLLASAMSQDRKGRDMVYGEFGKPVANWMSGSADIPLSEQRDRVRVRLIHRGMFDSLGEKPILRPINGTPLCKAYVVDGDGAVRFIAERHLKPSGMTEDDLDTLAMANSRSLLPREKFDKIMAATGQPTLIASGDSYDAARLLIMMDYLGPGQVLAVAVPDRDTLVVIPQPTESAWEGLAKVAASPGSPRRVFDRPLRVTVLGVEVR